METYCFCSVFPSSFSPSFSQLNLSRADLRNSHRCKFIIIYGMVTLYSLRILSIQVLQYMIRKDKEICYDYILGIRRVGFPKFCTPLLVKSTGHYFLVCLSIVLSLTPSIPDYTCISERPSAFAIKFHTITL